MRWSLHSKFLCDWRLIIVCLRFVLRWPSCARDFLSLLHRLPVIHQERIMHLFMEVVSFTAALIICDILCKFIKYEWARFVLLTFRSAAGICLTVISNHVLLLEIQKKLLLGVEEERYKKFKLTHFRHDVDTVKLFNDLLLSLLIEVHFSLMQRLLAASFGRAVGAAPTPKSFKCQFYYVANSDLNPPPVAQVALQNLYRFLRKSLEFLGILLLV